MVGHGVERTRQRCAPRPHHVAVRRLPVLLVALLVWCAACGGGSDPSATEDTAAGPRSLTGDEANRLAAIRSNAYRAGVRSFDGVVANRDGSVQVRGWVDTVDHWAYGLVSGPDVTPFLAVWTDGAVSARARPAAAAGTARSPGTGRTPR